MEIEKQFSSIVSLIGEPSRARMLYTLLDGRAFTATELAIQADVSAQSASMHLMKLVKADLLVVENQGRHRYFRYAKPEVAYVIEAIHSLIPDELLNKSQSVSVMTDFKYCRTCYDHLAGRVSVMITKSLLERKFMEICDGQYEVTQVGVKWFADIDICVEELRKGKRAFAQQYLDWSERRHHLAGALGAALLNKMLEKDWIHRGKSSRTVTVTSLGQIELHRRLGLNV